MTDELRKMAEDSAALAELLAMIHRDGGQYQEERGTKWAVEDAQAVWAGLLGRIAELEEGRAHLMDNLIAEGADGESAVSELIQAQSDRDEAHAAVRRLAVAWADRGFTLRDPWEVAVFEAVRAYQNAEPATSDSYEAMDGEQYERERAEKAEAAHSATMADLIEAKDRNAQLEADIAAARAEKETTNE